MKTSNNLKPVLVITDEFQSLVRELSYVEKKQLEENIKKHGCLSPIVIWGSKNIILDGHNRYEICTRNNIEFKTITLDFLDEDEAKIWMINNQFSRRNLSNYERSILALKLDSIIKEKARVNQLSGLVQTPVQQKSDKREKKEELNTNKYLSSLAGVSHDTIGKVRTIEQSATDEIKKELLNGNRSINEVYQEIMKKKKKDSIAKLKEINDTIEVTTNKEVNDETVETDTIKVNDETKKTTDVQVPSVFSMSIQDSRVFLWSTEDELGNTFAKMRKAKLKYVHCLVWDRGNEKSPLFFIVASFIKPQIDRQQVFPVYRENFIDDNQKSQDYYDELIKEMFSAEDIIKLLRT